MFAIHNNVSSLGSDAPLEQLFASKAHFKCTMLRIKSRKKIVTGHIMIKAMKHNGFSCRHLVR